MNFVYDYLFAINPILVDVLSLLLIVSTVYAVWRTVFLLGQKLKPSQDWKSKATQITGGFVIINMIVMQVLLRSFVEITPVIVYSNILNNLLLILAMWHVIYQIGNYIKPSRWWFWTASGIIVIGAALFVGVFFIIALSNTNFGL